MSVAASVAKKLIPLFDRVLVQVQVLDLHSFEMIVTKLKIEYIIFIHIFFFFSNSKGGGLNIRFIRSPQATMREYRRVNV